jgi:ketosteroid isomerase-like protein
MTTRDRILCYWDAFDRAAFDEARDFLHPELEVRWPNTGERFRGPDAFLSMNAAYPGRWRVSVERLEETASGWVSVVRVSSPDGPVSHHAVSFFSFRDGFVHRIEEYWGLDEPPPDWRAS